MPGKLDPPQLPLLSRSTQLSLPNLIVAVLSDKHPGISARYRGPANIVLNNLNTNVGEIGDPPNRRLIQIQAQMAQRNKVGGWDFHDFQWKWTRGSGLTHHVLQFRGDPGWDHPVRLA
jgi:hypothetical protein